MENSRPTPTSMSLDLSQSSDPAPSDLAQHLRRQVGIVADLLEHHQSSLIGPEQDWIENAINYTRHLLDKLNSQREEGNVDNKFNQRLSSLYNFKPRKHHAHVDAASLSSQLLVAMQNLNSAMEMLTRCARSNPQSGFQAMDTPKPQEEVGLLKTELSLFLNRGRAGRHSTDIQQASLQDRKVQTTIAELRASNSLLRSNTSKMLLSDQRRVLSGGRLPLTLAETVEIWRLNAEDALRAATVRFFEQEALPKDMADNSTSISGSVRSDAESNKLSPVSTPVPDSRQAHNTPTTTSCDATKHKPSQFNVANAVSSTVPRRKPVNGTETAPSNTPTTATTPFQPPSQHTTSQPINIALTPSISLDPTMSLSPSSTTTTTTPTSTSATSPYSTLHPDALVSAISITSATQHALHSPSFDDNRTDSLVSLPRPLSDAARQGSLTWQQQHQQQQQQHQHQPESRSVSRNGGGVGRKSRGRAWLERQAALSDD